MMLQAPHTVADSTMFDLLRHLSAAAETFDRELMAIELSYAGRILTRIWLEIGDEAFNGWLAGGEVSQADKCIFGFAMGVFRTRCRDERHRMIEERSAR